MSEDLSSLALRMSGSGKIDLSAFQPEDLIAVAGSLLRKIGSKSFEYINLASRIRTKHIIAGDGLFSAGGGHAWFGSLRSFYNGLFMPKKSMFLVLWSNEKIMHAVSHVAVHNQWVQQTGRLGARFTRSGDPVRYIAEGRYDGIKIRVVTTETEIITAFPINN